MPPSGESITGNRARSGGAGNCQMVSNISMMTRSATRLSKTTRFRPPFGATARLRSAGARGGHESRWRRRCQPRGRAFLSPDVSTLWRMMRVSSRRATRSPSPATLAEEILGTRARQHAAELGEARADMLALLGRLVPIERPSSSREGVDGVADELACRRIYAGFDLIRAPVPGRCAKGTALRRIGQ